MSKISTIHDPNKPPAEGLKSPNLEAIVEDIIFSPAPRHRRLKVRFWSRYLPGPMSNPREITLVEAEDITGDRSVLRTSWNDPAFKAWFLNVDENRERLEYLFSKSLDAMEQILDDPIANLKAVPNTLKLIGELANKFPSRNTIERFTDEDINKMNELQLKAWLERRGVITSKPVETKLLEEDVFDVEPTESSEKQKDN